ncbi:helix-turn-helix domain-containing protein [Bacillus salacetis]|uniref:helix-turn-helix domain-containing protein n=1 Tax=Bacillus salacetis TaxID=2315464 RepID=UPI003B9E963E
MMGFDFSQIGLVLKDLRLSIGMSQNVLCKGICSQSQLSKIESGEALPLATTLYLLSNRLGVTVNHLFDLTADGRLDYILDVKEQIRHLIRKKDYKSVFTLVQREEGNPNFMKNPSNRQFLLWHKGVSTFYIENNFHKAFSFLEEALAITKSSDRFLLEQEIAILNSMGAVHFDIKNTKESIRIFKKALNHIKSAPHHTYSLKINIRILFNLARSLTAEKEYQESLSLCQQGIELSILQESLYLLGELNHYAAFNLILSGEAEKAKPFLDQAATIFNMTHRKNYLVNVKHLRNLMEQQMETMPPG